MSSSRRELLKASGAGLAAAAAGISFIGAAHAQVAEESGTDPLGTSNNDVFVVGSPVAVA